MTDVLLCPHCQQEIPISEALAGQIRGEMEAELHAKLAKESKRLEEVAVRKAKEEQAVLIEDLKAQSEERARKVEEYQQKELELRKEKRALEEQKRTMELEVTQRLDAERKKVEEETARRVAEQHRLQDQEKEKVMQDMRQQIEELKHKSELGSQQNRGEVQELDLEEILKAAFPGDDITPVGKGVLGADIIQHVRNRYGKMCEKIVWESKRTKHWSDQWVEKLKDDSRKVGGFVSVVVTQTLPEGVNGFSYYKGVWVTDYHSLVGLTTALRMQIIHVCHTRDSMTGKGEKMELLYDYLTGHQFRQRVEAIVEAYRNMRLDLEKEKEAFRRHWSKREKEIERLTENTVMLYGEMQGLIGSTMLTIPALELTEGAASDEQEES